jgi:hypothetical protein
MRFEKAVPLYDPRLPNQNALMFMALLRIAKFGEDSDAEKSELSCIPTCR